MTHSDLASVHFSKRTVNNYYVFAIITKMNQVRQPVYTLIHLLYAVIYLTALYFITMQPDATATTLYR